MHKSIIHRWSHRAGMFALIVMVFGAMVSTAAAQQARIEARLIHATNTARPADPSLAALEPKLRNIFKFQSYQSVGSGAVTANLPSTPNLGLGRGNRLELALAPGGGNKVQAGIKWFGPSGKVIETTMVMTRGVPVILGGGQQDGGTMIIAVTAR